MLGVTTLPVLGVTTLTVLGVTTLPVLGVTILPVLGVTTLTVLGVTTLPVLQFILLALEHRQIQVPLIYHLLTCLFVANIRYLTALNAIAVIYFFAKWIYVFVVLFFAF